MRKKVFVSYSHKQAEWVRDRLCVALMAGGADVLVDVTRFKAGVALHQQMDSAQAQADIHLLVLSPDYFASSFCLHELEQAKATDPGFAKGLIAPVIRVPCTLPLEFAVPLCVHLADDSAGDRWHQLMQQCGADLGATVPHWLDSLERVQRLLAARESVHLRVFGSPNWKELFAAVHRKFDGKLGLVDLNGGHTVSRPGLVAAILDACGHPSVSVPAPPDDLRELQNRLGNSANGATLEIRRFDRVQDSERQYREAFFWTLSNLVETRKLTLLIESREVLAALVPPALAQSSFVTHTKTVELRGRGE